MKKCIKCNVNYEDELDFCPKCGAKVEEIKPLLFCPYCGKDLSHIPADFCPFCGHKMIWMENHAESKLTVKQTPYIDSNTSYIDSNTYRTNTSTDSNNSNAGNSEKSNAGSLLKSAFSIIGFIFLMALSKACGRGLVRGTTPQQKGFFIGAVLAGVVSGIIPAFVAYKFCKFDSPSTAVGVIFILQIIISLLSANGVIPLGSIPIGIIIAILLYLFNKK